MESRSGVVPGFMVDLKLIISTIHVILFIILLPLTLVINGCRLEILI